MTLDEILQSHRTRRPVVMGILNVTPDSFSDGGAFLDAAAALDRARHMVAEGADVLDVGAESTRPGSEPVSEADQRRRLEPILPELCRLGVPVSVDTTRAGVAEMALAAGAQIVNDVSAGRDDPALLGLVAQKRSALVLMHMLGEPKSMQQAPRYDDVVGEVRAFLAERLAAAEAAGVDRARCIVDPGIGFGKSVEHNLALLAGVGRLAELGVPVLIGASRKRFIASCAGPCEPDERLGGSLAAACAGYLGGATIFRVHDVRPTRQALAVLHRMRPLA